MREEEEEGRGAAEERIRVQEVEQRAGVVVTGIERHALHDVRERDTPEEGGHRGSDDDHAVERSLPLRLGPLVTVLERDAAGDQREEDEQQREVEPREERGVPLGESCEQ